MFFLFKHFNLILFFEVLNLYKLKSLGLLLSFFTFQRKNPPASLRELFICSNRSVSVANKYYIRCLYAGPAVTSGQSCLTRYQSCVNKTNGVQNKAELSVYVH